jgi:FdhD protein
MQIRLDDVLVATTMRTPGDDFELAVGFCWSEGLLGATASPTSVRYCATGSAMDTELNVVSVTSTGRVEPATPRLNTVSSSCGLCGSTSLDSLSERFAPLSGTPVADPAVLAGLAERVAGRQQLFAATGGSHAAGAFGLGDGEFLLIREDIGRHNAVDKVLGRLALDGRLPASDCGLWVSGRASLEIVQKAWAGGFGVVISVSAVSSLAVEAAKLANIALFGFGRGDRITRYTP